MLKFRDTDALKVLLIRATGRYFSAGADLRSGNQKRISPTAHTARGIRENHRLNLNNMQQLWDEMEHIEKPIVVAHHAMCVGGGLEMSLSCDFPPRRQKCRLCLSRRAVRGAARLQRRQPPRPDVRPALGALADHGQQAPPPPTWPFTMGLVHQVFPPTKASKPK